MRKVLLDAHTHTVASGHAYSSLQEMAKAASDMGLEVLGITEHGPSVPGTCPTLYFKNMFLPSSAAMPTSHSRLPTTSVFIRSLQKLISLTN